MLQIRGAMVEAVLALPRTLGNEVDAVPSAFLKGKEIA